jgi:polyhydroxyalkanoate synthesis regulator phasin
MNPNNLFELIHQGFLITVGATASLIETVQDSTKREIVLSDLAQELSQRTQEWTVKGESTEKEARKVIDQLFSTRKQSSPTTTATTQTVPTPSSSAQSNVELEIKELTEQVIALRTELEMLRKSDTV